MNAIRGQPSLPQVNFFPKFPVDGSMESNGYIQSCDGNQKIQAIFEKFHDEPLDIHSKITNKVVKSLYLPGKVADFLSKTSGGAASFLNALKEDEEGGDLSRIVQHWNELEPIPFQDISVKDSSMSNGRMTGFPLPCTSIRPRNTEQLLEAFISLGRNQTVVGYSQTDSFQGTFALTPADPSVVDAIKSDLPAGKWMDCHLVQPGLEVSDFKLKESQKTRLINAIKTEIVPRGLHHAFDEALKRLSPGKNSVHEYGKQLIDIVFETFPHREPAFKSLVAQSVSSILIEKVLPVQVKKILSESAVRIARIHWADEDVNPIHLACFFDPVAKVVSLCILDEDGGNLRPQEQDQWMIHIPWESYGIKLTHNLHDHKVIHCLSSSLEIPKITI
ncbi:MAG: hypothetical protein WCF65_01655 [Parachlamydiaceae bacterium]